MTRLRRCECGHQNTAHEDADGGCEFCPCEWFEVRRPENLQAPLVYAGPQGAKRMKKNRKFVEGGYD
jgi:hypothetical protein